MPMFSNQGKWDQVWTLYGNTNVVYISVYDMI